MGRLGVTALVLVLLAATAAAFAITERLKLERAPVTAPRFDRLVSPTCGCRTGIATLKFTLRRADRVDASIVNARGDEVRSLAVDAERRRGAVTFEWDGKDDERAPAPDGLYRLRLDLEREGRAIVVPTPIRVDGTPPEIELTGTRPRKLSPDGDGRGDRMLFTYRASEIAYAVVFVRGKYAVRGKFFPAGPGRVSWRGRLDGRVARPGAYEAWLVAIDRAGNRSRPTKTVSITVRYVELVGVPRRVRAGSRVPFSVDADAKEVIVAVQSTKGTAPPFRIGAFPPGRVSVPIPRTARGLYAVLVSVQGAPPARAFFTVARP